MATVARAPSAARATVRADAISALEEMQAEHLPEAIELAAGCFLHSPPYTSVALPALTAVHPRSPPCAHSYSSRPPRRAINDGAASRATDTSLRASMKGGG